MAYDLDAGSPRPNDAPPEPLPAGVADEGGAEGRTRSSDRVKMIVLALLLVVGIGVVAWQFLRAKGPKEAAAQPGTVASAAARLSDIDAVLQKMTGPGAEDKQGFTLGRVEQLVKEFDTYIHQRQVALKELRTNPFEVVLETPPAPPETKAAKAAKAETTASDEETRREKIREAGGRLNIGSILVSSQSRMAVINESVCTVGDVVEGFKVDAIEPDRVLLSSERVTVELRLFEPGPKPASHKGRR